MKPNKQSSETKSPEPATMRLLVELVFRGIVSSKEITGIEDMQLRFLSSDELLAGYRDWVQ